MRGYLMCALAALLAGCVREGQLKSNLPAPTVIEVPVATYKPIDPKLTKRCDWPKKAKPSQAMDVGNKRKACLIRYELQFDAIDGVQGKPVPDTAADQLRPASETTP